jgi:hypothetical protein
MAHKRRSRVIPIAIQMLDIGVPSRLRFRLLGPAQVMRGDAGAIRITAQKGFALLAYLAMHQGAPVGRALLADLLWGDRIDAKARQISGN